MRHYIDMSSVLRRSVCDLYSNLVTRPTGVAVRREIENYLSQQETPRLMVIDFSEVGLLDFSCADEVIGKLLVATQNAATGAETYFIVRGVRSDHLDAIESAIKRYELALIVETHDGTRDIVGVLDDFPRRAWRVISERGRAVVPELVQELETPHDALMTALELLRAHRLVMLHDDGGVTLPGAH